MKKPDIAPIQEGREQLYKIANNIHLITSKQIFLKSNQLPPAEKEDILQTIYAGKKDNVEGLKKKLKSFTERIKTSTLHYLVFFVGTDAFDNILDCIFQIYHQQNDQFASQEITTILEESNKQFQELLLSIVKFADYHAPQFLPNFCRNYFRLVQRFTKNFTKQQGEQFLESEKKKTKDKQNSIEEFKNILTKVIEIKADKKKYNNASINQIFKMVLKHESRDERADDLYEEISLNWIKFQLEEMRKDKQHLCCKTIFFKDQKFEYYRKKYYEVRPFTKISDNPKISDEQLEISQSIAAFMNSKGGVIFLGITHEQNKYPVVTGFDLEQKYKKEIVRFIRNAVNEVLPKHKHFQMCTEKSQHYYNSAYELNYYISIEFMNVVKPGTFENCRHQITSYQKLYVCKIAVKMGHPRYLYYVLKNEGNRQNKKQAQIQYFTRGEQCNEKETLDKNYDLIYKKLTDYAASKDTLIFDDKERVKIHDGCLYDMTMKPEIYQLEDPDAQDDD